MTDEIEKAKLAVTAWNIGQTSAHYESSGKGADVISTGDGDHGGASYGTYQLSTKMGTLQEYLNQSIYRDQFEGLTPLTPEFDKKWVELARTDSGFAQDQHNFIGRSHFAEQLESLREIGLDISNRGRAVHDAVWSTAVQFRHKTPRIFDKGLEEKFGIDYDFSKLSDKEIVEAVQEYKVAHNNTLFKSSSKWWPGLLRRAHSENEDLIRLADYEVVLAKNGISIPLNLEGAIQEPFKGVPYAIPRTRSLQLEDRGLDVTRLQNSLKQLNVTPVDGNPLVPDGDFGARTREAVEAFQHQYGMPVTGIADKQTLMAVQVGVRAIESVQGIAQFDQQLERRSKDFRSDWLQPDAQGLPNYLHTHTASTHPRSIAPDPTQAPLMQLQQEVEALRRQIQQQQRNMPLNHGAMPDPTGPMQIDPTYPSPLAGLSPNHREHALCSAPTPPTVRPPYSDTRHPDHALYEAIREQLPPGTSDDMAAHATLEAKLGGIIRPDQIRGMAIEDGRLTVMGKTGLDFAVVDLTASAPPLSETLQQSAAFDQQQSIQLAQFQEQQRQINARGGPTMTL